jgi:hypothetical protein
LFSGSGFDVKQGSEIAPRRRGGHRVNKFLFKKFSELCEPRIAMPESFRSLRKSSDDVQDSTKHFLTTKITKNLDRIFSSKLHVLRVLRGHIYGSVPNLSLARFAILDPPSSILVGCGVAALCFCSEYFFIFDRTSMLWLDRSIYPGVRRTRSSATPLPARRDNFLDTTWRLLRPGRTRLCCGSWRNG